MGLLPNDFAFVQTAKKGRLMATYPLKIARRRSESEDTASLWFEVPKDLAQVFRYRPGQFLTVEAEIGPERVARQYSLSSSPERDSALRITVKRIEGGRVSGWLVDRAREGDLVEVQQPRGRFFKEADQPHHAILLAAGSGIAPILPIGRWFLESGQGHRVTLVYGSRTPEAVILGDEVAGMAASHPLDCSVEHVMSRADDGWAGARGRINRAYIEQHFQDWTRASDLPIVVYMCGPEGFMDVAESAFQTLGVPLSQIHRESFDMVLDDDDDAPGLTVTGSADPGEEGATQKIVAVVGGEEYEADWLEGEDILSALLRVKADVPYSCQEGTCSSCIAKLTEGRIEVRPGVLQSMRQSDLDEGLTLACLSQPRTRNIRIDFDEI